MSREGRSAVLLIVEALGPVPQNVRLPSCLPGSHPGHSQAVHAELLGSIPGVLMRNSNQQGAVELP